jgi:homoserine kinase type II
MKAETRIQIVGLYKLGKIHSVKKLHDGLQTPKVLIETSKGKFVISKHKLNNSKKLLNKSKKSLSYEIELLNILKELPVPHFIKSKRGNFIENIDNSWFTVDKFIPGKKPEYITPKMAYQLGSFLGDFHKKGKKFKKNISDRRKFYFLNKNVIKKMYIYANKQTSKILKSIVKEVKMGVEKNRLPQNLPKGPIHVDIKPDNEIFIGEKLSGVLDFGNFYIDAFMIDIGKTIMWNCVRGNKIDQNLFNEFIKGYKKKRKLTKEESKYLTQSVLFAIYSHIWVDLYHVSLRYVPENYTLNLVKKFLPVARNMIISQTKI